MADVPPATNSYGRFLCQRRTADPASLPTEAWGRVGYQREKEELVTDSTEPRDLFAAAITGLIRPEQADTDEPEETTPRAPRPDLTQASGANGATPSDPRDLFAAFVQNALGGYHPSDAA